MATPSKTPFSALKKWAIDKPLGLMKSHPVATAGILGPIAADLGTDMGLGIAQKFGHGPGLQDFGRYTQVSRLQNAYAAARERERQIVQNKTRMAAMTLMQVNPHLAQQLLAGEMLAPETVVIGGKPRIDLFQQVVGDTINGQLPSQQASGRRSHMMNGVLGAADDLIGPAIAAASRA